MEHNRKSATNSGLPHFGPRVIGIVGPYGSGKSEIALTLAEERCALAKQAQIGEQRIALADLDVLKPYFRSREARASLAAAGVRLIAPEEGVAMSDLPVLPQEIRSALADRSLMVLLDIGGDAVGARALGSVSDVMGAQEHDLLLVVNRHRPFMLDIEQAWAQANAIQAASRLRITGIISNTHLMMETTLADIHWGLELAEEVARRLEVSVRRIGVPEFLLPQAQAAGLSTLLPIRRRMLPQFLGGVVLSKSEVL